MLPETKSGKRQDPEKFRRVKYSLKYVGTRWTFFFLAAGFFLAIVWALQLDFYINLPNFSRNRKYAYFLVNIFRRIRKRNDAMNLFTLFRNISFFYWFVWEFLGHCSWVKTSLKLQWLNILLVACPLLLFTRYSSLSARCSLLSLLYFLHFAHFFLHFS